MTTITKETETINVTDLDLEEQIQKAEFYLDEFREDNTVEWQNGFRYAFGIVDGSIEVDN